jgi:hypothetical protein
LGLNHVSEGTGNERHLKITKTVRVFQGVNSLTLTPCPEIVLNACWFDVVNPVLPFACI